MGDFPYHRVEDFISSQAIERPDALAIVSEMESLTYFELDRRSTMLATALLEYKLQPGEVVSILLPQSAEAIISILAVLKCGCTYAPLDYSSPPYRLAQMLDKLRCSWVISGFDAALTLTNCLQFLPDNFSPQFCWITGPAPEIIKTRVHLDRSRIEKYNHRPLPLLLNKADLAYIIFTSGTTGVPKGVSITQRNLLNFIKWMQEILRFNADDKIILFPPLHFDGSVIHVFGSLTSGAQLHIIPQRFLLQPVQLITYIRSRNITQWMAVPSLFISVMAHAEILENDFPELKRILWGGEAFPIPYLRKWMSLLPHVEFINSYGPAESTVACSYYVLTEIPAEDADPVPIGHPVNGMDLSVLNDLKQTCTTDEVGILYVSGEGLSPGYYKDEQLTRSAFLEIPIGSGQYWYCTNDLARKDKAGTFHFYGRSDRQIKSRGYRIELDDIEAALNSVPGVKQSAVIAISVGGFESYQICAAYVIENDKVMSFVDIKTRLSEMLPFYMLPKMLIVIEELPVNANGKTNYFEIKNLFTKDKKTEIYA